MWASSKQQVSKLWNSSMITSAIIMYTRVSYNMIMYYYYLLFMFSFFLFKLKKGPLPLHVANKEHYTPAPQHRQIVLADVCATVLLLTLLNAQAYWLALMSPPHIIQGSLRVERGSICSTSQIHYQASTSGWDHPPSPSHHPTHPRHLNGF